MGARQGARQLGAWRMMNGMVRADVARTLVVPPGSGLCGVSAVREPSNYRRLLVSPGWQCQRARVTRSSTRAARGMFGLRHTCRWSKGQA
jgi:hypothetical protein